MRLAWRRRDRQRVEADPSTSHARSLNGRPRWRAETPVVAEHIQPARRHRQRRIVSTCRYRPCRRGAAGAAAQPPPPAVVAVTAGARTNHPWRSCGQGWTASIRASRQPERPENERGMGGSIRFTVCRSRGNDLVGRHRIVDGWDDRPASSINRQDGGCASRRRSVRAGSESSIETIAVATRARRSRDRAEPAKCTQKTYAAHFRNDVRACVGRLLEFFPDLGARRRAQGSTRGRMALNNGSSGPYFDSDEPVAPRTGGRNPRAPGRIAGCPELIQGQQERNGLGRRRIGAVQERCARVSLPKCSRRTLFDSRPNKQAASVLVCERKYARGKRR